MNCISDARIKLNCSEREVFGYFARSQSDKTQICKQVKDRAWEMYVDSGKTQIPHEMATWLLALQTGMFELDGNKTYPLKARRK